MAEDLDTPWALAFLPDKSLLLTERRGRVLLIDPQGKSSPTVVAELPLVTEGGEGGLLGLALSPHFAENHYVYLYYTFESGGGAPRNQVVRMTYAEKKLQKEKVLVDNLPAASNHNGGRLKFGPDGYLYVTTGDAENPSQAQRPDLFGGKILRFTEEGQPAPGNPFGSLVYSFGHRNAQGLAWDEQGRLWATEHGRSGLLSGLDELNLIELGKNYGCPVIQGSQTREGMVSPVVHSGPDETWAPAGIAFAQGSLYFGGLRGQALYQAKIKEEPISLKEHFKNQFGRIRDVVLSPDGDLYLTTSNRDGRGRPQPGDDKVIRINLEKL